MKEKRNGKKRRGSLVMHRKNLTFLNLINTSLNHPIWGVILPYDSRGKWHLSALMLSFREEIKRSTPPIL